MSIEITRRSFLTAMAGLTGGMALAACAPKEPTAAPKAEAPKADAPAAPAKVAEQVDMRYISWWGSFNTGLLPDIMKDFKDVMPNVNIKLEEKPQSEAQKVYQTTLVAGTAADIIYHENYMSVYYDNDLILELDNYYDRDGINFQDDFYHGLGINDWNGKIYGFPHMFETCVMMYNKDMIKEKWGKDLWEAFPDGNWTIDDMVEVAKACTVPKEIWGLFIYHRHYYYGYETQSWTRGDNIFNIQEMKYNFSSPTIQAVTDWLLDAVMGSKYCISSEDSAEINAASGVAFPFQAGKVGMRIRMSPDVGRNLSANLSDKFDWDLMYLPNSDTHQAVTRAGGHGHNISAKTKLPEEAWEFVKFCGTTPGMKYIADTRLALPVYRKDPSLRANFLRGEPEHDSVLFGVLEDRGGYGDHMRFHNEGAVRALFQKQMDLFYNMPYEEAKVIANDKLAEVEAEMNELVEYGDTLPFKGVEFPFPPPAKV